MKYFVVLLAIAFIQPQAYSAEDKYDFGDAEKLDACLNGDNITYFDALTEGHQGTKYQFKEGLGEWSTGLPIELSYQYNDEAKATYVWFNTSESKSLIPFRNADSLLVFTCNEDLTICCHPTKDRYFSVTFEGGILHLFDYNVSTQINNQVLFDAIE